MTNNKDDLPIEITAEALTKMRALRLFFAGSSADELAKIIKGLSTILEERKKAEAIIEKEKNVKDQKLKDIIELIRSEGVTVNDLTNFIDEVQPARKGKKNK